MRGCGTGISMKIIGMTGGVGAGKSQLLAFMEEEYNARVFQADEAGHRVMEPGTEAYRHIIEYFGKGILAGDGQVDRRALGALVFSHEKERKYLNGIIHPAVKALARQEIAKARSQGGISLFVIEAALLIEDHYEEICDELWYVYADEEVRKKRLRISRGYSDEKIAAIFASQLADAEFRKHCHAVIDNSDSIEESYEQIRFLLRGKI